jgi:Outer membrane protein beta-barrel domain
MHRDMDTYTMNRLTLATVSMVFLAAAFLSTPALEAQATMPQGSVEVSGSAGISSGLGSVDKFTDITGVIRDVARLSGGTVFFEPGSNTKWNVGVSGGYAIQSNLMIVGEVIRTRLLNPTLRLSVPLVPALGFGASLIEATAGVQYQAPLRDSKIAPFVGGGIGLARSRLSLEESTFNILDLNFSDNHFIFNVGGGAQIYFTDHWGVRPEFKFVHIPNESWVRSSVGLFYQFGK